jgi:hypothetical protein
MCGSCDKGNQAQGFLEVSEFELEKSEMSTVEFASSVLRSQIAPAGSAESVKGRIRLAARRLGWSHTRTKDVWYGDPRLSIRAEEMRAIEEHSGVKYGREEIRTVEQLIASADALLGRADADFHGPSIAAMRAFFRALAGSGIEGRG